jgi:leucyl-tRNA synthetase
MRTLLVLLNPFAPHLTSELWEKLGAKFGVEPTEITQQPWPGYDEALLVEAEVEIVVQINGKMRARLKVATDASKETLKATALALPKIAEAIAGKEIRKAVIVPNKLVNIVTN